MIEPTNKFWEEIYDQNIKKMIGICYRYTYDRQLSEDLAHDAFVAAYQKIAGFEGKGPFEAWLRRIVINVCLQHIREKSKEKYVSDFLSNQAVTMETNDENPANEKYDIKHEELLDAINQLPEHHKVVFNLYVIDKFTHAQIGKELGISEGTSKSHLARARKKIKQILIEKLDSEKEKRKGFFLIFGFPVKLRNIEGLYRKRFRNFEIENQKQFSFDSFDTSPVQIPAIKPIILAKYLYATIAAIGVGTFLIIYLNIGENDPVSEKERHNENRKDTIIKQKDQDSTATNTNNGIIVKANKFLTNKNDTMKISKALSATLLAGSVLGNAQGQVIFSDTVLSNSKQFVFDSSINKSEQSDTGNFLPVSDNSSGTFYASGISWSADNYELYLNGKVIADIGKNQFTGSGSFSVIGKVHYLVVDGNPVKLGTKVNLDKTKKYKLTQLSADRAIVKYGDAGKEGAVEIELAE